jgi:FtsP/CotA-like multicopper oxidase with cupredoxin domain
MTMFGSITRRNFLRVGATGLLGVAGGAALYGVDPARPEDQPTPLTGPVTAHEGAHEGAHGHKVVMPAVQGEVDHARNGFNPTDILTDFDAGKVTPLPDGRALHEYEFVAQARQVELAPGIGYPAWTYNGRIPGPTIRAREGDRIRINFRNATSHPHSIHLHSIHPAEMDGVFEQVQPGGSFVYEVDAEPAGVHLYHCHTSPLAKHLAKGLYGALIIDPKEGWPAVDRELVMVMSGFDVDADGSNEFYAVNGIPFHYDKHPIQIKVGEKVRVFLVNILEYDPINSFHLHANFFHYYPTGTSLSAAEYTDTIVQMQGQRGMLEFSYRHPGTYMFHAHKTEFAELGWTGLFQVEA